MAEIETREVTLPDQSKVTIRLQNGNDEDILSRSSDSQLDNISKFLAAIIVSPEGLTGKDIEKWKVSNKYYLLLASRVFNFGSEFTFSHTFEMNGKQVTTNFTEELDKYLVDFSNPEEVEKAKLNNPLICKPYLFGTASTREIELPTGKKVRYEFLTGVGENMINNIPKNQLKINDVLRARNLSIWDQESNTYKTIKDYANLTSRELAIIRKDITENDFQYGMEMDIELPDGQTERSIMIQYTEFFFPQY